MYSIKCTEYILRETRRSGSSVSSEIIGKFDNREDAQSIAGGRVITYQLFPDGYRSYGDFASRTDDIVQHLSKPFHDASGTEVRLYIEPIPCHFRR